MKTYLLKLILILTCCGLIFTSCTEKIDIDLDSTYKRLVVEGAITSDTTGHMVKLSKTSDYFSGRKAPVVSGAVVTISDGTTSFSLTEKEPGSGIYETETDVYGREGKTYTLNIELLEEIDGAKNYTATDVMKPISPVDSIKLKYFDIWDGWQVQCYAQDPPTTEFYMFNIYKNSDHITDTINKVLIVDDRFYNGSYTNGIGVGFLREEIPREKVHPNDTITLKMGSITEEFANFTWEVQEQTQYQSPLFSGPPANVNGNISNGAIGFFAAYSTTYASVIAK